MMLALAQQIIEGAGDAIIFADGEGKIRLWNAAAERVFGYPAAEALGCSLDLIVPEKHRPCHWEGYTRVMQTGETKYGGELLAVPAIRRDGSRISIEFTVTLVWDDDGAVQGIAAIVRDVSARREAETSLRRRLQELEQRTAGGA
jgi:PAS domain S-box-containing protein